MKISEAVAMLNEYAKVAGEDCEIYLQGFDLKGRIRENDSDAFRYYRDKPLVKKYFIEAVPYGTPQTQAEMEIL